MKESVRPHENQSTGRTVATPVTDTAVDAPTVTLRTSRQTERIDENMPLLALDQLACIEAMRIDAGPPFSALFTL